MKIINRLKKTRTIVMALIAVLSMSTMSYASPKQYVSNEGIGIAVCNPNRVQVRAVGVRKIISDSPVRVSGGSLWSEWDTYTVQFRAKYEHGSKTHRSSATNGNAKCVRSTWVQKGMTAVSPWLAQSFIGNKVWAATK